MNCQRCGYPPATEDVDDLDDPYDGDECDCIPPLRLEEYDTCLSPKAAGRLVREARRLTHELEIIRARARKLQGAMRTAALEASGSIHPHVTSPWIREVGRMLGEP